MIMATTTAVEEAQVRQLMDGELKITHEHFSVPFDMESNKALFDLKP
jgi:hypothetical protein